MSNTHKIVAHGKRNQAKVALTFDDGPNPYFTPKLLDILDEFNAKATFFVLGKYAQEYPGLLKKISNRGHLIGNHTFSHHQGDFRKCDEVVQEMVNISPQYVRPPFCDVSFCKKESDYLEQKTIITGDVNSKDYTPTEAQEVVKNVARLVKKGSIITMHDSSDKRSQMESRAAKTVKALPKIIEILNIKGFDAVTLADLNL